MIQEQRGTGCDEPTWLKGVEQPQSFRLIDVERLCVIEAPFRCRYFALSYVWGDFPTFQCKTENVASLREQNSFSKFTIPRTIQDAITLVSSIGERYLWVDTVCIIQDDAIDKAKQIGQWTRFILEQQQP
jgi:hypothetical protein